MFRGSQVAEFTVSVDEPQSTCKHADAHRGIASFETLKRGEANPKALGPSAQRFFPA
jgi:hypothetical protein